MYKCYNIACGWEGESPNYMKSWTSNNTKANNKPPDIMEFPVCPKCGSCVIYSEENNR